MNRLSKILRLILFLALAASVVGQGENEGYFQLSSSRTYGSGGKPKIALNAWNVGELEFRVYRIHDSAKFFGQLEHAHEFGGNAPRPPHEKTLLESLRAWKRTTRATIRRSLRAQFSSSPSERVESLLPKRAAPSGTPVVSTGTLATRYAEAPVLNPQQLVMTFPHEAHGKSRWEREDVEIPVTAKGVYLVEAVHQQMRAYTVLIVSDIVMVSKTGQDSILNFVVDRRSGQPVEGVEVQCLVKGSDAVRKKTDADGIAALKVPTGEVTVLARSGEDIAVNSLGLNSGLNEWVGYIYTDRPVYRPGHTMHFKGVLRLRTADGHEVPAGAKVSVEIQDPDQKSVYQKSLTVSATGAIFDELTLAANASLGNYYIQVRSGAAKGEFEGFMGGNFEVQAYKKPEYEVRVTPSKGRVLQGETVQAVIDARYFFGEPVSGAKVKYSVYRTSYWFPLWYDPEDQPDGDAAADSDGGDFYDAGDQLTDQDGVLDADGKLTIEVPTSLSEHQTDSVFRIEAHVTDQANREITGSGRIIATYGSFVLNLQPDRYVYAPGSQASLTIQARDYDLKAVQTPVHVELLRLSRWEKDGELVNSMDVRTGADGNARAVFSIPGEGGSYRVRATAKTPENRQVNSTSYLWVSGGSWVRESNRRNNIEIIPDKKTYKPGETAKVLFVVEPGAAVFLTVEGRDIRRHQLIRAKGSTVEFQFPIEARYEPGLTVSAIYIRDGVQAQGSKYLRVPPVEHQLNVKLATDKPQYLPGQTAEYSLDVTDASGKPVSKAELSLGVVDEAIYGVVPDQTPAILPFFFGHDYNRVNTQTSLQYYFSGEAGKRRMQLAELRSASKLAQLKPERVVQPKIRKAFPDTAFWAPDLMTDVNGHARAKVDFPDSLTTWRATARGVTVDTSVGSAVLKTIVRKNLILRLATPRFLVQGDEVTISGLVHNYLTTAKTARVSLDVKGATIIGGGTQDVQISARGEATVQWRVRPLQVRTITLTGKALTDEESDALELEVPVNFEGLPLSTSQGGSVPAGAGAAFDLTYPPGALAGSRSLSLHVAPSMAGSLFTALDFLTSFPYGCVEQTMSGFLPNIIVKDAMHSLGLKANLDEAALQEKIQAGLDRLYSFQHEDGGWGWWQTDDSHPFMTAYVVAGLVQARSTGTAVNAAAINKGVTWLHGNLAADPKLTPDFKAYLIYALAVAGKADSAETSAVFDRRADLSPYGKAMLGLALEAMKDGRAAGLANDLEAAVKQNSEQAWWPATRDPLLDFETDATPEATAWVMRFLSHQKKDSSLLPKAALWLVNHRNEGFWWSTTKQTAMVIYGLMDYLKNSKELSPNMTATVFVNDQQVLTQTFNGASSLNPRDIVLVDTTLQPGVNHVRVVTTGEGRLYYGARADYFSSDTHLQKSGSTSLNLLRDYFKLVPGKDGDRIVYDLVPQQGPVSPGDTIAVRLTVTGSAWKYMMLEDPIPAGTGFVEKDRLYELRNKPPWWQWYFDRRELHDDHLAIFQTFFPQGQREYFYLLKVVNPGLFHVNPARVGPMYQNDVYATTESRILEVR